MRALTGPAAGGDLSDGELAAAYAAPVPTWLRVNMVSTVDGAATGADGLTGSVNNAADPRVFHLLRHLADAVVGGAGTARAEGYPPGAQPLVVVTRSGEVPPMLRSAAPGAVLLATCRAAPSLGASLRLLGAGPRIAGGELVDVPLDLRLLLEEDGTLLGRWLVRRARRPPADHPVLHPERVVVGRRPGERHHHDPGGSAHASPRTARAGVRRPAAGGTMTTT